MMFFFESPISYLMIILLDISIGAAQHEYDWMRKEKKKRKKNDILITTGRFCFTFFLFFSIFYFYFYLLSSVSKRMSCASMSIRCYYNPVIYINRYEKRRALFDFFFLLKKHPAMKR